MNHFRSLGRITMAAVFVGLAAVGTTSAEIERVDLRVDGLT